MKIKIQINRNAAYTSDVEQIVRTTFAHITDKISIESITTNGSTPMGEVVTVICLPQGSTIENASLADEVRGAISSRGYLTCLDIQINKTAHKTLQINAIQQIEAIQQDDTKAYQVDLAFASYVADNSDYRSKLINTNVYKVSVELEEIRPNLYLPTRKLCTESTNRPDPNPTNPYRLFAKIVDDNKELQEKLSSDSITRIAFDIKPDGKVILNCQVKPSVSLDTLAAKDNKKGRDAKNTDYSRFEVSQPSKVHIQLLKEILQYTKGKNQENFKPCIASINAKRYNQALRRICTMKEKDFPHAIALARFILSKKEALNIDVNEKAGTDALSAMDYAEKNGNQDLCKLLIEHGAKASNLSAPIQAR